MRRTTKKRVWIKFAQGCFFDGTGIEIIARIGSRKTKVRKARDRFGLTDGQGRPYSRTNNSELLARYFQLLEDLKADRIAGQVGAPGSLAYAIDRFLDKHPVTPDDDARKHADYRYLLQAWTHTAIATVPVLAIRRAMIADILDSWTAAGLAPSTVNSRKRALGDVLRVEFEKEKLKRRATGKDDDDVIVPTDLIPGVPPKELEARGVDLELVEMIIDTMSDRGRANKGETRPAYSENKIRARVMLWTGLGHKSLMRLNRRAVRFHTEEIELPARKKGRRPAPAVWVDALPQAIDALRQYDAAKLWGKPFSRSSMHKAFTEARDRLRDTLQAAADSPDATDAQTALWEKFQATVPANFHPYDARHSFLTEVLRRTGDRTATMQIGQHKTEKMLDRYTKGAVAARVSGAVATLRAHWAPGTKKPNLLQLIPKADGNGIE